jgi:hypothetical protein
MTYNTGTPTLTRWQPWTYRDATWLNADITGYTIDALDGEIGKVDKSMHRPDNAFLIVDTGPWIFGEKVMLPAGIVSGVDHNNRRVFVERTKEQIKSAPKFDAALVNDPTYRNTLGAYYGEGTGWYQPPS